MLLEAVLFEDVNSQVPFNYLNYGISHEFKLGGNNVLSKIVFKFCKECKLYSLHCPLRFRAKLQVTNSTSSLSFDF